VSKASVVSRVLAVIGVLALSVTGAQAGGGSGGGANVIIPWQCYLIDGDHPAHDVVNLTDQFGTRENVQLGRARLLCTPVTTTRPDGGQFDPAPVLGDHITCYTVSPFQRGPRGRVSLVNPDAVVDLNDELNTDRGVSVGIPAFVCTLSDKTCVSGADCPTTPPE
jgi:hypothetical protein